MAEKPLKVRQVKWTKPTIFLLWELRRNDNGIRTVKFLSGVTHARRGAIRWAQRYGYRSYEERKILKYADIVPGSPMERHFANMKHNAALKKEQAREEGTT